MDLKFLIEEHNNRTTAIAKLWNWYMILSIFGIVALLNYPNSEELNYTIPIIKVSIPSQFFLIVYLMIISSSIIKWNELYTRLLRFRQNIIEPVLKKTKEATIEDNVFPTRSIFDAVANPTNMAVWGIVPDFGIYSNRKWYCKIPRLAIYSLLKIGSFIINFLVPLTAIIYFNVVLIDSDFFLSSINSLFMYGLLGISWFLSAVALISLLRSIVIESTYIIKVINDQILFLQKKKD